MSTRKDVKCPVCNNAKTTRGKEKFICCGEKHDIESHLIGGNKKVESPDGEGGHEKSEKSKKSKMDPERSIFTGD